MNLLRKTPVLLAFSSLIALAAAVGCSQTSEDAASSESNVTANEEDAGDAGTTVKSGLVISQVYGGGGNAQAPFTHDFVELFNQSDSEIELAGKTLQYVSSEGNFRKDRNILTLPETTPKLGAGKYFLIQLAPGSGTGAALTDVDYTPTEAKEILSLAGKSGKVALTASADAALEGCGGSGDGGAPCADDSYLDLVGYGSAASQFRGAGPTGDLSNTLAAIRHSGGCAHAGDNSVDFVPGTPAPRNNKLDATPLCSTVDASAPPPVVKPDAGPAKSDASAQPQGDDDDSSEEEGDDDDDTKSTSKPKTPKKPTSNGATVQGAEPPQFSASRPEACAMGSGPLGGSFSGAGAVFGLALACAALRRRRA